MTKKYKPEFLTNEQKQFIRRHRKALMTSVTSIGLFLAVLFFAPYVIDYVDMKNKEVAINRISERLHVDAPGEWREDKRCVRNSEKFRALPPTCHVGVSAIFEIKSNEELRSAIDSVQRSLKENDGISFHEPMDDNVVYSDLLREMSDKEKMSTSGEIEVSSSQAFEVRWAPAGRCSVIFRLTKTQDDNEDEKLLIQVGCSKESRSNHYRVSPY